MSGIEKLIRETAQALVARCKPTNEEIAGAERHLRRVADAAVQGERERAAAICSRMVAWLSPSPGDGSYRRMTDKLFSQLMDAEFELRNPDEYAQAVAAEPAVRAATPGGP